MKYQKMVNVLKEIIDRFGYERYSNNALLWGTISDLAEKDSEEQDALRVLRIVIFLDVPAIIVKIKSNSEDRTAVLNKAYMEMEKAGLSKEWCAASLYILASPLGIETTDLYPLDQATQQNQTTDSAGKTEEENAEKTKETKNGREQGKQSKGKESVKLPVILTIGAVLVLVISVSLFVYTNNRIKKMEDLTAYRDRESVTEITEKVIAETEIGGETESTEAEAAETETDGETESAAVLETAAGFADTIEETAAERSTEAEAVATEPEEISYAGTVIEWEDPGMEQYIRAALNRPEGDITSGELANVKVLRIGEGQIVLLEETAGDSGDLNYGIAGTHKIKIEQFEDVNIDSLQDLKWMPNLVILQVGWVEVTDISALKNLTNLTELSLEHNSIEDISALGNLTNLTKLDLLYNNITNIGALGNLTNLTELDLEAVGSIQDFTVLGNLTNLVKLDLRANSISDINILENLTGLTKLRLSENDIEDISALENLMNLTFLELGENDIKDISALKNLTNLTYLDLGTNDIEDISALESLTNLMELHLQDNRITDINDLANLTNLKELSLDKNTDISPLNNLPDCSVRYW